MYKMLGSRPSQSPISIWSEGLLIWPPSPHFWSVPRGCSVIGLAPSISVTWPSRSPVIGQMLRLDCSAISVFGGVLPRPVSSAISGPGSEFPSSVVPDKWRDTVLLLSLFEDCSGFCPTLGADSVFPNSWWWRAPPSHTQAWCFGGVPDSGSQLYDCACLDLWLLTHADLLLSI